MTGHTLAVLAGVTKVFGDVVALDGVSLAIERGQVLAVLGPNGAGKSTAIALLLGVQRPAQGQVRLFGGAPGLAARRRIGVMMQEVALAPELKAREHIALVSSYYPSPMTVDDVMALSHVAPFAHRPYGKLSGGQKRLVQFAMALCGRPDLLFLDEPTAGLDVQARALVWESVQRLRDRGTAVVLTTHYLEEAEALADRVAVLARGRLVAEGTVAEIRSVVDRKRIVCSTTLAAAELERWPGVESVGEEDGRIQLTVRCAEAVVRRLLLADERLCDLEIRRAGLAEAFTELTQEVAR